MMYLARIINIIIIALNISIAKCGRLAGEGEISDPPYRASGRNNDQERRLRMAEWESSRAFVKVLCTNVIT